MKVQKGENLIVRINLKQQDGSALNLADLISLTVEINQLKKTYATYTLGDDPEIREGETANEVEIEIKTSVTSQMVSGFDVYAKLHIEAPNDEFEVDPHQFEKTGIKIFSVL